MIINAKTSLATVALSALMLSSTTYAADGGHGHDDKPKLSESDIPTLGDASRGQELVSTCVACHGAGGNSAIAENPKLAGQSESYLYNQLVAFKSGERENAIMSGQVANLSDQDMKDIASYYAEQTPSLSDAGDGDNELGKHIYLTGIPERDVPSCIGCHGANGMGMLDAGYPMIAGQHQSYLESYLNFMGTAEINTDNQQIMYEIAKRLREDEISALSSYIQGLKPNH